MAAKDSFLATIAILESCLGGASLVDGPPNATVQNAQARFLRQGLAVLVFSAMEAFVRERTAEVLVSFKRRVVAFSDLPEQLQKAITIGALDGIRFRLKLQPAAAKVLWLSNAVKPIANASSDISRLSEYSFGYSASNLTEDDVEEVLKAFGVEAPWQQITSLVSRCGITVIDCKGKFVSIKERRHDAAHALTANVLHPDLVDSIRAAKAICMAFDLLVSNSCGLFNRQIGPGVAARSKMKHSDLKLVFMAPTGVPDEYKFVREPQPGSAPGSCIRKIVGMNAASDFGVRHARLNNRHVIVHDSTGNAINWISH